MFDVPDPSISTNHSIARHRVTTASDGKQQENGDKLAVKGLRALNGADIGLAILGYSPARLGALIRQIAPSI